MAERQSARDGDAGAVRAGRRLNPEHSRNRRALQCSAEINSARRERLIERVHALGPRPLAEMLAEIAVATGQHVRVVDLVEEYAQLDPAVLRFLGGDKFPPNVVEVVK